MSFAYRLRAAAAAALSLATFGALAQSSPVELIPRALFFGNPTRTQGLVSPDGQWISWIAPREACQAIV